MLGCVRGCLIRNCFLKYKVSTGFSKEVDKIKQFAISYSTFFLSSLNIVSMKVNGIKTTANAINITENIPVMRSCFLRLVLFTFDAEPGGGDFNDRKALINVVMNKMEMRATNKTTKRFSIS